MARSVSRQSEASHISFRPAQMGSRAVFLVEVRGKKEARQVRELFDMVGKLAEVVPISSGSVMSYAVQVHGETSLFGKVEWLLKAQFPFSLVERSFSDVTFHLIRSLCEDSEGQMSELPQCGCCGAAEPFPSRATIEWTSDAEPEHLAYCARCSALHAHADVAKHARALIRHDRSRIRISDSVPVTQMPEMAEVIREDDDVQFLAATG